FYERKGPTTGSAGLNHAEATMKVNYKDHLETKKQAKLVAYVTTLCPCSKEISEYSAHSQRGKVTMEVTFTDDFNEEEQDSDDNLQLLTLQYAPYQQINKHQLHLQSHGILRSQLHVNTHLPLLQSF